MKTRLTVTVSVGSPEDAREKFHEERPGEDM